MDGSRPGFPVLHSLSEFAQTHVHWVSDAIQPSCPVSSPLPPAFNLSQHHTLFQWVGSLHQVAKYWSFSISPSDECLQLVSSRIDWFDLLVLSDQIRSVAQSCPTLCDPINNYKNHKMCSCVPRVCKGSLSLVVKLITQKDLKLKRENCSWKSVKEDKSPCTWTKSLMMGSIMTWGFEGAESTVRWTMKWSVKLVVQTMRRHDMAGTVLSLFSLL